MNDSLVEDRELDDELRRIAARLDPVPDALVRAAEAAYVWRGVDAELAELAFDSLAEREGLAVVRGAGEPRLLTFHAADLTVELEVSAAGPGPASVAGPGPASVAGLGHPPAAAEHRLVGQLLPPGPGQVEVRHPDGVLAVTADELGRFTADRVAPGPVSLRCQPAGAAGAAVVTEWVPI